MTTVQLSGQTQLTKPFWESACDFVIQFQCNALVTFSWHQVSPSAVSQFQRWEPARFLRAHQLPCSHITQARTLAVPFGGGGTDYWVSAAWLGDPAAALVLMPLPNCMTGGKPCNLSEPQFPHQKNQDNLTHSSELLCRWNWPVHVTCGARNLAGTQCVRASGSSFSYSTMSKTGQVHSNSCVTFMRSPKL